MAAGNEKVEVAWLHGMKKLELHGGDIQYS